MSYRTSRSEPYVRSVLRIVAAFMFMLAGASKLFGFPTGEAVQLASLQGLAGVLETFGGAMLLLGLFTRPVAFLVSGQMAVAYFMVHAPKDFWPTVNGGVPAVLYCFIWFYFVFAGAGAISLDRFLARGHAEPHAPPGPHH